MSPSTDHDDAPEVTWRSDGKKSADDKVGADAKKSADGQDAGSEVPSSRTAGRAPAPGRSAAVKTNRDPDPERATGSRSRSSRTGPDSVSASEEAIDLTVATDDERDEAGDTGEQAAARPDETGFVDDLDDLGDAEADDDRDDGAADAAFWDEGPVRPVTRTSRRQKRKEWRKSEKARRYAARRSVRFPIFTRSVLLWMLLFAMVGVSFGGSGAIFWAHFNSQISELKEQTQDFDKRSAAAQDQINAMRNQAISDINDQIKPIAPYIAESRTIQLAGTFAPFVWFVETYDENGQPSVGSAFAVATEDNSTLMVTSLNTVRASSLVPSPDINLTDAATGESLPAQVVAFDADRDLALLRVARGGMQILDWASDEQQSQALALRIFPVSGFGGAGASLTSGVISDQNAKGFLHSAPIGQQGQGGPIVTADGKVIGVGSLVYRPLGFDPGEVHFSIPINQVCEVLMECGGGARRAKVTGAPPAPAK